jgi:hypothetical protein
MTETTTMLDIGGLLSALAAALYWWRASRVSLRRLSKAEEFDYHDINRLIVSFNRAQILSGRAALATALSALFIAGRFSVSLVGG